MNRTCAQALVLVNWKGVFYERYLIDRHVTALEGANGAGKTTVMIAAYVVLLPDMSRLRFTNLGETGATGGDKGIWGRLGEQGRPAYSAIDFALDPHNRIVAGVHLERKGEPSVEPTPFIITGLGPEARLQDVFLLSQGTCEAVPELNELRENAARLGGRMQTFGTARDYFAALFEHGVTPLRLGTDEERNKLNEMLRTSMTGGISRALTSELRSFLLKEETGLAENLQRMRANLDACRRTRTEVQESQRLEREIGNVFEAGQTMFAAVFLATRERADERRRLLAEAEEAQQKAQQQLAEVEEKLAQVRDELSVKGAREESLSNKVSTGEEWLRRLELALSAARDVARWREELLSADEKTRIATGALAAQERVRTQRREALRRCEENYIHAARGLADRQRGLDELHRRAGAYRQVIRRKADAERLLGIDMLPIGSMKGRIAEHTIKLEQVDRSRRDAKQRVADASDHRQEHATVLQALGLMAGAVIEPTKAHATAVMQLSRFRDLNALAARTSSLAEELAEARTLASRQAEAWEHAEQLGLSFSGQQPARVEIMEHLERVEQERELSLQLEREAQKAIADCQQTIETSNAQEKLLTEREPIWGDLENRARRLAQELELSVASLSDLQTAREIVLRHLTQARATESELIERRERLQLEARDLLAAGGPFAPELLRLKDELGAELLAGAFEEASLEDAAVLEARLGPLAQALVVDDPASVAKRVQDRSESLSDVWLVGRDADAAQFVDDATDQRREAADVIVLERQAVRISRIPSQPRLGRKAREKRAAELRAEADLLESQIDTSRAARRRFERLAEDSEALLSGQVLWLAGDPAPEIEVVRRLVIESEAQQTNHRTAVIRHGQAARELRPRIEALRGLLGEALLLDPPNHAHRRDALERDHGAAVMAQAEIKRCGDAVRVVEDRLDVLRQTPLTEAEVGSLQAELTRFTDERSRLDSAIEAMEFVAANTEALGWDDAPKQLEKDQALFPAFEEQLRRAEEARAEAEAAAQAADDEFDRATTIQQNAEADRVTKLTQLQAAKQRFTEFDIADPTETAVEIARAEISRLKEEARRIAVELGDLKKTEGQREEMQAQAANECGEAEEKVANEHREAAPAVERWERLKTAVADHGLLSSTLVSSDSDVSKIRGHVNLVQEAHKQRAVLVERLRSAQGAQELLAKVEGATNVDLGFAKVHLELWLAVRDWSHRRLPAQVAEVDDPREALLRLRDQLTGLEERLTRQEDELRGRSEDVARGIEVQIRKARGQVDRLNQNLRGVSFGSIVGIRVRVQVVERMEQVLRALREGAVQGLLFQGGMPIEDALDEIFRRYGGGRTGGQRLLDYREYVHLQVEVRRTAGADWEIANPTRLSTGEAIGVGAALMMVVLTEWERDANLLRGKRTQGSLRFLFLDEANRLSHDNLGVLFSLCKALDLQLLIAAPEVARADGNTTYRLVRRVDADGREEVIVSGRRTRAEA